MICGVGEADALKLDNSILRGQIETIPYINAALIPVPV